MNELIKKSDDLINIFHDSNFEKYLSLLVENKSVEGVNLDSHFFANIKSFIDSFSTSMFEYNFAKNTHKFIKENINNKYDSTRTSYFDCELFDLCILSIKDLEKSPAYPTIYTLLSFYILKNNALSWDLSLISQYENFDKDLYIKGFQQLCSLFENITPTQSLSNFRTIDFIEQETFTLLFQISKTFNNKNKSLTNTDDFQSFISQKESIDLSIKLFSVAPTLLFATRSFGTFENLYSEKDALPFYSAVIPKLNVPIHMLFFKNTRMTGYNLQNIKSPKETGNIIFNTLITSINSFEHTDKLSAVKDLSNMFSFVNKFEDEFVFDSYSFFEQGFHFSSSNKRFSDAEHPLNEFIFTHQFLDKKSQLDKIIREIDLLNKVESKSSFVSKKI